jgi:YD repeat-containing protein
VASLSYSNAINPTPSVSFTWDSTFRRPTAVNDGSGTNSFSYVPYGSVGGEKVSSMTTPLAQISYSYDSLGRLTGRQIGSNSETLAYDALGRLTADTNPLGSFAYGYVEATARLASLTMPGGIKSTYSYYGNTGSSGNEDQRLSGIVNTIGTATASEFGYQYDVVGNIGVLPES